mgnify:CR=1 FL=1
MTNIVFGTDGWRGVIARDYTFENLGLVAHATARYVKKLRAPKPSVVVGHDTRFLSREFAIETARILASYGITVHLTDTFASTPQVSFHTKKKGAQIGIVITASHNPAEYNGFKVKGAFGGPAIPEQIAQIEKELAALKGSRLDAIDLNIGVTGAEGEDFPFLCSLDDGSVFAPRQWCEITYMWKASGLCHKPLYFEDVHLERYGHSWGPVAQPLLSGAHFFGSVAVLPYKMGLQTPNECVYALGYYRPGSCAPYMLDPIPFTWRAGLFQAGAVVGVAAILP